MNFLEFKKKYQKVPVVELPNKVLDNNPNPVVSCIVTTYQHRNYIKDCLDGILMQKTNFPFEIIIGEDESTDGTRDICIEYAKRYPDIIRLFLNSRNNNITLNEMPSAKFNFIYAFNMCRSMYVSLCEGDDYWTDPLKLQKQVDYMENNPGCVMCTHAAVKIDINGNKIGIVRPNIGDRTYTFEDVISRKASKGATASFVYLKSITDNKKLLKIEAKKAELLKQLEDLNYA